MIHGAFFLAFLNKSRTRAAPKIMDNNFNIIDVPQVLQVKMFEYRFVQQFC